MEPTLLSALIGFLVGVVGYIIAKFWIMPVSRYRKVKKDVAQNLVFVMERLTADAGKGEKKAVGKRLKGIRKHAKTLSDSYNYDLPPWYKILLDSRKESPVEAARLLLGLGNVRDPEHARKWVEKIRKDLIIDTSSARRQ